LEQEGVVPTTKLGDHKDTTQPVTAKPCEIRVLFTIPSSYGPYQTAWLTLYLASDGPLFIAHEELLTSAEYRYAVAKFFCKPNLFLGF